MLASHATFLFIPCSRNELDDSPCKYKKGRECNKGNDGFKYLILYSPDKGIELRKTLWIIVTIHILIVAESRALRRGFWWRKT